MADEMTTPTEAGAMVRQGFEGDTLSMSGTLGQEAMIAASVAEIQARIIVAKRFPRDLVKVRLKVLEECRRYDFASEAWYVLPSRGKDRNGKEIPIEGFTIRFAEACVSFLGNTETITTIDHEDTFKRRMTVRFVDIENNNVSSFPFVVDKTIERNFVRDESNVISQRTGSTGKIIYTIKASEADLAAKVGALKSKAVRNAVLAMLPAGLKFDAEILIKQTLLKPAQTDPVKVRTQLVDAFYSLGVPPEDLVAYCGKPLEQLRPDDLVEMRNVYAATASGEVPWSEILENRLEQLKMSKPTVTVDAPVAVVTPSPQQQGNQTPSQQVTQATEQQNAIVHLSDAVKKELESEARKGPTALRVRAKQLGAKESDAMRALINIEVMRLDDMIRKGELK